MYKNSVYISSKRQKIQFQKSKSIKFKHFPEAEERVINIYPELKYQTIEGFGGAFTEASADCYDKMSSGTKQRFMDLMFDKKEGLSYNFCRTTINSCDFSKKEYTYVQENDQSLKTFDISNDKEQIIPMIKDAFQKQGEELFLLSSPWSPCGWMKDTGRMLQGGKLKPAMYSVWAKYFVKYIKAYADCGVEISAVTVQNEPMATQTWESCVYTSREQIAFVRDHLYPAFKEAGLGDVKIMIWDHNKENVYDYAKDIMAACGITDQIWGIAFHWYSGEHFDGLKFANEVAPNLKLVATEFCFGGLEPRWRDAEKYAYDMIGNFNNFMVASCDWNLILNEQGGPYHDRNGACKAVLHYNTPKDEITVMPHYYAVAHFSKFVKRGAKRLGTTKYSRYISACAFENPGGEIVCVILNSNKHPQDCLLRIHENAAEINIKANSITTVVIEK